MAIWNSPKTTGPSIKVNHLTSTERSELTRAEMVIREHLASYAAVGTALATVRDKQLFRESHESFEAYVSDKWKISPQHANRLIAAAGVATNLEPIGSVPDRESHARPLTSLSPDDQVAAWQEAQQLAGDEPLRVSHIEEAARKRKKTRKPKLAKQVSLKVPGARVVVIPNKAFRGFDQALADALAKLRERQAA